MNVSSTIFREYDIRGIVGDDLTVAVTEAVGRAYATRLRRTVERPVVAVGYDNRPSSPELADALAAGLNAAGANVRLVGTVPTPALYYAADVWATDGGIQITGSHNPPEYNGYKVYWQNGAQIVPPHDGEIASEIEEATRQPLPWVDPEEALVAAVSSCHMSTFLGAAAREGFVVDDYRDDAVGTPGRLIDYFKQGIFGLKGIQVAVIDEAYVEYADADDFAAATELRDTRERLAILRTFSKAYGLAGLRVGYLLAARVTPANEQERDQVADLAQQMSVKSGEVIKELLA